MAPEIIGPTSSYYVSQRLRLHYVDWGNEDKPLLLLVHGGRDHARSWDWVARELRDEWHVLDNADMPVATIREDSMLLAIIRRFLSALVPQNYTVSLGASEESIGTITGTWNPFIVKYDCNFTLAGQHIDPRLLLAGVVLLMCIEGKQN